MSWRVFTADVEDAPGKGVRMPPMPCTLEVRPWGEPPIVTLTAPWWVDADGVRYHIPAGFVSDGPSVPERKRWWLRWCTRLLNAALALCRFGKMRALRAAVFHDWLYATTIRRRGVADRLFRLALAHDGVGPAGRWLAWAGTRLGGADHYSPDPRVVHLPTRDGGEWRARTEEEQRAWLARCHPEDGPA